MTHLFTPRASYDNFFRPQMQLSDEDKAKTGRGRWRATVTDQLTGQKYRVAGASCGVPNCHCDAVILETVQ